MKLVIDTSILIDYLRNGPVGVRFFEEIRQETTFFLPTVVIFELFSGQSTQNVHAVEKIERFIAYFQRIELTEKIAKRAGGIYRDTVKTLDVPDYIIAASAFEIGGTVVTINRKHFEQIPGLSLYRF